MPKDEKAIHLQQLEDAFWILMRDCVGNASSIEAALGQMSKLDKRRALKLWKAMILQNKHAISSNIVYAHDLVTKVCQTLRYHIGIDPIYNFLKKEIELQVAVFFSNQGVEYFLPELVEHGLLINDCETADVFLNHLFENPYKEVSFGELLKKSIPVAEFCKKC